YSIITQTGFLPAVVIVLAFTAGSAFVMWLGEQITEFGIGNGISMILFANIISGIPSMVGTLFTMVWWQIIIVLIGIAALILFIVFINDAERRIPIQYAKRVVGRKIYGGQNTNLPIKVSMSGVMPIIFAQSICSLPATICAFTGHTSGWWYTYVWSSNSWTYAVIYFLMIFFFSWFYSTIQYDPVEISNNLKKNGGFIPGFRPGKSTAEFIQRVINKIVIFGAVYLGIVALLPIVAGNLMTGVRNLAIGGTSVIIVVGVALETVKALEAQMLMRHYKGFLD
ncbi:MAG: preprotein translocase subunit SecY, partial [Oscillospiraceae bacterium]|nr:preprotein translocase subunit SecY [Oscillospiraceae bacterium]